MALMAGKAWLYAIRFSDWPSALAVIAHRRRRARAGRLAGHGHSDAKNYAGNGLGVWDGVLLVLPPGYQLTSGKRCPATAACSLVALGRLSAAGFARSSGDAGRRPPRSKA